MTRPYTLKTGALPVEVVGGIWLSLGYPPEGPGRAELTAYALTETGRLALNDAILSFCRVAIAPPHHASGADIAAALNLPNSRVLRAISRVVETDRLTRGT